jgi:ElaB/YqjD/DUF883 family membrane-anchored ribosome-binding protein
MAQNTIGNAYPDYQQGLSNVMSAYLGSASQDRNISADAYNRARAQATLEEAARAAVAEEGLTRFINDPVLQRRMLDRLMLGPSGSDTEAVGADAAAGLMRSVFSSGEDFKNYGAGTESFGQNDRQIQAFNALLNSEKGKNLLGALAVLTGKNPDVNTVASQEQQQVLVDALTNRAVKLGEIDERAKNFAANQQLAGSNYAADQQLAGSNYAADRQLESSNFAAGQQLKGDQYAADQQLKGDQYAADQQLESSNFAADRQLVGSNYAADRQLEGSNFAAGQQLKGDQYAADQQLKGDQYAADQQLESSNFAADRQLVGSNYAADRQLEGSNFAAGQQLKGDQYAADQQLKGDQYAADRQRDAAIEVANIHAKAKEYEAKLQFREGGSSDRAAQIASDADIEIAKLRKLAEKYKSDLQFGEDGSEDRKAARQLEWEKYSADMRKEAQEYAADMKKISDEYDSLLRYGENGSAERVAKIKAKADERKARYAANMKRRTDMYVARINNDTTKRGQDLNNNKPMTVTAKPGEVVTVLDKDGNTIKTVRGDSKPIVLKPGEDAVITTDAGGEIGRIKGRAVSGGKNGSRKGIDNNYVNKQFENARRIGNFELIPQVVVDSLRSRMRVEVDKYYSDGDDLGISTDKAYSGIFGEGITVVDPFGPVNTAVPTKIISQIRLRIQENKYPNLESRVVRSLVENYGYSAEEAKAIYNEAL